MRVLSIRGAAARQKKARWEPFHGTVDDRLARTDVLWTLTELPVIGKPLQNASSISFLPCLTNIIHL